MDCPPEKNDPEDYPKRERLNNEIIIKTMFKNFVFCILVFNLIFPYFKQDPIMIGLSGAYSTLASGYNAVGINPANLAFSKGVSVKLMNMNINMNMNITSI